VPVGTTDNVSCAIYTSATSEKKEMVKNSEKLKQNTNIILIELCLPGKHTITRKKIAVNNKHHGDVSMIVDAAGG
jgi:hypothetical protein